MRPKVLLPILLLFCLALLVVWHSITRKQPPPSTNNLTATNEKALWTARNGIEKQTSQAQPQIEGTRTLAAAVIIQPPSDGFQQWLQDVQPPINFYGRVLDQNEQPVEGASIEFAWTHVQPQADFRTNVLSDATGSFALSDVHGSGLDVSMRKSGYYPVRTQAQDHFNYIRLPGDQPFQPDAGNPVIFHLRKKGAGADLITSKYGVSPELEISIPRNGHPVSVDLLNRKASADGQLLISQMKPDYFQGKSAKNWSFRMEIPSGGFMKETDEFPYEAPVNGYQTTVESEFQKGQTNWTTSLTRSYYISFGQPPRYGWLTVETEMGWGGVRLRYAINPDGSRYLEPKEPQTAQREIPPGMREVIPNSPK